MSAWNHISSSSLQTRVNSWLERNKSESFDYTVTVTVGELEVSSTDRPLQDALQDADREMYRKKQQRGATVTPTDEQGQA